MREYTYCCNECGNNFSRNYIITTKPRNPKRIEPVKIYCSKECRVNSRRKERRYKECIECGNSLRILNSNNPNNFCSNICKGINMSKNSIELGLSDRANKMRENRPNDSWKKGIETRKKNGNIIDWDKVEWKQYWRRCNDLTRKIRKQMLEFWDGYDYIDGEYIKNNLSLPYTHKDYPTLDHIKSRSQCFKEGLSPYEATIPDNLKWTKRCNNSKKYNK